MPPSHCPTIPPPLPIPLPYREREIEDNNPQKGGSWQWGGNQLPRITWSYIAKVQPEKRKGGSGSVFRPSCSSRWGKRKTDPPTPAYQSPITMGEVSSMAGEEITRDYKYNHVAKYSPGLTHPPPSAMRRNRSLASSRRAPTKNRIQNALHK